MFDLAAYAFNAETTEKRKEHFKQIVAHSQNYGCFSEEKLMSQVISTPFTVDFHGTVHQMAGIGCVSSYPEYRGQGGISAIMSKLLADLADQGVSLAYLAPFSYPFYRKYGFEQLFEQISYTVKAENWPNVKVGSGKMKRVNFEEIKPICQTIYAGLEKNQRGGMVREDWWLDYSLGSDEKNLFAVYEDEQGTPTGYLVYQSSAARFTIKEWGYLSYQACQALVGFIGSHSGSSQEFYFETGQTGQDVSHLMPAPLVDMKLTPFMMGRIVSIDAFLSKYPFKSGEKETYYFEIEDRYGAWNEGIWKLVIDETGQGTAKKCTEKKGALAGFRGSIQAWTQLFMGYRTSEDLLFYEKVSGDREQLQALENRLVKGKPVLEEYF
ncbi:GNAT family N-acetyltransferase [Enterococcus wangshanyuanii]|nr:GNAT family N-acetyltransferase [Enterococcus wangshanyuanii]